MTGTQGAARPGAGGVAGDAPPARDPRGVTLRPMRWWDLDAVIALEHDLFPEDAWSRGMFWSELAGTRHPGASRVYVVAEDAADGRLVGYAGLAAVAGTADVQTIATARDHWGTGLGARLLTVLLRAATAAECREVLLEVRVDNDRAQRLYRRFGFEPIGYRRGYYQPGNVDALVMRLADPAQQDAPTAPDDAQPDDPGRPDDPARQDDSARPDDSAQPDDSTQRDDSAQPDDSARPEGPAAVDAPTAPGTPSRRHRPHRPHSA